MLAGEETRKQCSSLVRRTKRGRSENSGCKTVFQTQTQGSVRAKSDHTISHCLCPPPSELRQRRGEAEADDETMIWREREVDHGDPAPDCQPCAPLLPILPLLLSLLFLSLPLSSVLTHQRMLLTFNQSRLQAERLRRRQREEGRGGEGRG